MRNTNDLTTVRRLTLAFIGAAALLCCAACQPTVQAPVQSTPSSSVATSTAAQTTASVIASTPPPGSTAAPGSSVGDLVKVDDLVFGVAGGKMLTVDGAPYLALKVYVARPTGDGQKDVDYMAFTVKDSSGASYDTEDTVLIVQDMRELQAYSLEKGDSAAGWIAFPMQEVPSGAWLEIAPASANGSSADVALQGVLSASKSSPAAKAYAGGAAAEAAAADARTVTMAEYKQIRNGMSYAKVKSIVGFAGEEAASSGDVVIRTWSNGDGGNVSVTFRGNRVVGKAQAGL
jgi:hypothetical protein